MINRTRYRKLLTDSKEGEQTDHLEALADRNEVERLIIQVLTEHREFNSSDPEDVMLMKALADAICERWNQYRQRNKPSTPSKHTHTKSRMRQHYYPMSNSRSGS